MDISEGTIKWIHEVADDIELMAKTGTLDDLGLHNWLVLTGYLRQVGVEPLPFLATPPEREWWDIRGTGKAVVTEGVPKL